MWDSDSRKLDVLLRRVEELHERFDGFFRYTIHQGKHMTQELDALTQAVATTEDDEARAIVLLQGLAAQIASNANDPAKLQALADGLNLKAQALKDAMDGISPSPAPVVTPPTDTTPPSTDTTPSA
jgi:hypothetical protein